MGEGEAKKCPAGFTEADGPNPHGTPAGGEEKAPRGASDSKPAASDAKAAPGEAVAEKGGRCPWPFIFFHDAGTGMRDWQTWFVVGLAVCWIWSRVQ